MIVFCQSACKKVNGRHSRGGMLPQLRTGRQQGLSSPVPVQVRQAQERPHHRGRGHLRGYLPLLHRRQQRSQGHLRPWARCHRPLPGPVPALQQSPQRVALRAVSAMGVDESDTMQGTEGMAREYTGRGGMDGGGV